MRRFWVLLTITTALCAGCKKGVKQQQDSIYSRHLQRHIPLEIITTPMPENKAEMNLLFFTTGNLLEEVRAKQIIDSLYKKKLIQPLTLVSFAGQEGDYGLQETNTAEAKQHKKFNDFIINELYPFAKKKAGLRKFYSVGICGIGNASLNALDVAWDNDEKVQKVGMFFPGFYESQQMNDSAVLAAIKAFRKRPELRIWLSGTGSTEAEETFKQIIGSKEHIAEFKSVDDTTITNTKMLPPVTNFADFILWAYHK